MTRAPFSWLHGPDPSIVDGGDPIPSQDAADDDDLGSDAEEAAIDGDELVAIVEQARWQAACTASPEQAVHRAAALICRRWPFIDPRTALELASGQTLDDPAEHRTAPAGERRGRRRWFGRG